MKTIAITIITIATIAAFSWALLTGIERSEKAECLQWQKEAKQFAGYYLTKWQAEQCMAHNIKVEAPIKTGNE
jgi:hypothetical protein